jgi:hypothetical protein
MAPLADGRCVAGWCKYYNSWGVGRFRAFEAKDLVVSNR